MTTPEPTAALDAAELLPCPFCGSDAEVIPRAMPKGSIWFRVVCEWDGCGVSTSLRTTEAEAIAAWNQRDDQHD